MANEIKTMYAMKGTYRLASTRDTKTAGIQNTIVQNNAESVPQMMAPTVRSIRQATVPPTINGSPQ